MTNRFSYNLNEECFAEAMLMNNGQGFDFVCSYKGREKSYKVRRKRGICIG